MKDRLRFLRIFPLAMVAVLLSATVVAQTKNLSDEGVLLDRIVAVVNNGVVLQSELEAQLAAVLQSLPKDVSLPPMDVIRQQVLDRLIVKTIQLQLAKLSGISVSDEVLNGYLQDIAQRNGISFEAMPEALEKEGINYALYREQMREEIVIDLLKQRDVVRRVRVSPNEIKAYLENQKSAATAGQEYNLSHILIAVPPTASPNIQQQALERAQDIYLRLEAGEDFCELALAYSDGQQALECGDLGWRAGTQLPNFLADVVIGLEKGEISEPIHNPSGYHIVRLNEIRGEQKTSSVVSQRRARHILIETNALIDDQTARQKLLDIRAQIEDGKDFAVFAKAESNDTISARDGGDLGWQNKGTFVPEFEAVLDALEPGVVSEPFKTDFGWHIVEVLDTREYDNTEELQESIAYREIRTAKVTEEMEVWLQRLRDEAYVDYRL